MKKILYLLPFLLLSCNFKEDPKNSPFDEIPLGKLDALTKLAEDEPMPESKLLFTARGTEPGWLVEIYAKKLRLLANYGADSLSLDNEFEKIDDPAGFTFTSYSKTNDKEILLEVSLLNKTCSDDATGEIKSREVILKYKNKIYKGCGEFEPQH